MNDTMLRSLTTGATVVLISLMIVGCESGVAEDGASLSDVAAAENVADAPVVTPPCDHCGTITAIRELSRKGDASGLGAATGAVIGGVVGRSVANKRKDVVTVVGAIGGGVAGHEIEKQINSETYYEIEVRMEDGGAQMLYADELYGLLPGAEVEVVGRVARMRAGT